MAEPFMGQIIAVGFNFPPRGYALCDGQLLSIAQNQGLFSLLGTTFGGDGLTTFGLPDLRGRVPIHQGQGPGLSNRTMGERSGVESVSLNTTHLPAHTHTLATQSRPATAESPNGNVLAGARAYSELAPDTTLAATAVSSTGSGSAHPNMQPYLVVNYAIALQGIYPSRT